MLQIDSQNIHNYINNKKAKEVNYFFHPVNNIQVLIANDSLVKSKGQYENVKLKMGDYNIKT